MGEDFTFVPQITGSEGNLEISMTSQENENTVGNTKSTSKGSFMTEKLNFAAIGYVYHPRFLVFLTSVSERLDEKGSFFGPAATATDYELRSVFLPEHPYNLELFTLHRKASSPGTFWKAQTGTTDSKGATFSYKQSPYFFGSSYVDGAVDSGSNRTSSKTYQAHGAYILPGMSNAAAYSHNEAFSSSGMSAARDTSTFSNTVHLADISLSSRVNSARQNQNNPLNPEFQTRTFDWTEQLFSPLPWNFSTNISYGNLREVYLTGEDPSSGAPEKEAFNRSSNSSFNLSHHLYESLVTNYTLNEFSMSSYSGEITARSNSLSSTYLKAIPSGRLSAGIQYGKMVSERLGTLAVLNETHSAALFGAFSLIQQYVIESSIQVQVKDPGTGSFITLPKGNYFVQPLGAGIQITVLSVSPVELQPDPAYLYEFHVSYSLSDQSKLTMASKGYSLKLDLFNNLLSPYYNYSTTDQELVSGSLAGGPDLTTNKTAGVACQTGDYSGLIEHQSFQSRLNPYEAWKTTAEYRTPLSQDTTVSARLFYQETSYLATPSATVSGNIRETRKGADLSANMGFPRNHTNFLVSGSYSLTDAVIDSDAMSINSYLTWQVGLLSLNGGAQVSRSESKAPTGNVTMVSQYYYVTVTRKLF